MRATLFIALSALVAMGWAVPTRGLPLSLPRGRDVLYPFKITFDPQRRLIEFVTSEKS